MKCDFYWGSHGCDLEAGHDSVHHCGGPNITTACSEYDETTGFCRYTLADVYEDGTEENHEWGEWHEHGKGFRYEDVNMVATFEENSVSVYVKEPE